MIVSTVLAATLASTQPAAAPAPAMDHSKMEMKSDKEGSKMDCCKDGCACCAKDKPSR